jgi:hypothetical protein
MRFASEPWKRSGRAVGSAPVGAAPIKTVQREPLTPAVRPKASTRRLKERREIRAREQMVSAWLRSLSGRSPR